MIGRELLGTGDVFMGRLLVGFVLGLFLFAPAGCGPKEDKDKVCREGESFAKACKEYGRCVRSDSKMGGTFCHSINNDDCRASTIACKEMGRCGASGEKSAVDCVVVSEADCENSDGCKINGFCGLKKNSEGKNTCMATKAEHCRKSQKCKDESICHLGEDSCFNVHMGNR